METLRLAPDKKNAERLGAHLVFADESGFLLIPNLKRTWAPRGQTPTASCWLSHAKLSALSALVVSPQHRQIALYLQFRQRSFKGPDVARFVAQLLQNLRGPIVLLWDGARIHQHHQVTALLHNHPRLVIQPFPGYAPELNPAEYVWAQADSALANSAPAQLSELKAMLSNTKRRMRRSPALLWACLYASDLPWKR